MALMYNAAFNVSMYMIFGTPLAMYGPVQSLGRGQHSQSLSDGQVCLRISQSTKLTEIKTTFQRTCKYLLETWLYQHMRSIRLFHVEMSLVFRLIPK